MQRGMFVNTIILLGSLIILRVLILRILRKASTASIWMNGSGSLGSLQGIFAASLSPLMMTVGFIVWDECWKGSAFALNLFKCTLASTVFSIISMTFWSHKDILVYRRDLMMIALSSFLGIVIGDNTWLLALQKLGAFRVIVVDCLKPSLAAALGYLILEEPLTVPMALGIVVTTVGVYIVSVESLKSHDDHRGGEPAHDVSTDSYRTETGDYRYTAVTTGNDEEQQRPARIDAISEDTKEREDVVQSNQKFNSHIIEGYVFAFINVALDAYGSVLTKQYGVSFNTWEINSIRFGFAAIIMGLISLMIVVLNKLDSKLRPLIAGNNWINAAAQKSSESTSGFIRDTDQRECKSREARFMEGPGTGDSANGSDIVSIEDEAAGEKKTETESVRQSLSQDMVEIHLWDTTTTTAVNGHAAGRSTDGRTATRVKADVYIGDSNSSGQPTNTRNTASVRMGDADSSVTSPWYLMPNRTQMSPSLWLRVSVGVLFVTFLCPMLSNYALFKIDLGLCLTLTSLGPIYAIPILWLIKGDVISLRAMIGSLLAVAGVAIMCLL